MHSMGKLMLTSTQVNHSQKLNEKPLTPWVIALESGKILAAHCDCAAEIGETCSHVVSLLWVIGVGVESRDSPTVTQKSGYWVMPPAIRLVPYAPLKDIDFIGKKRKSCESGASSSSSSSKKPVREATESEQMQFLNALASCPGAKPAVLVVTPGYCDAYIPTSLAPELLMVLSDLYQPDNLSLGYKELLKMVANTDISVTGVQATAAAEQNTRGQATSRLWFHLRIGRVTASKFKRACHTDPANPSLSLIMSNCHPEAFRFKTAATAWGCQHEKTALEQYREKRSLSHQNHKVSSCGFFISVQHPFIGASPDGLVECSCCGQGICEVKVYIGACKCIPCLSICYIIMYLHTEIPLQCPFCHKDDTVDDASDDSNFCLEKLSDGTNRLKKTHAYFYQVCIRCKLYIVSYKL